MFRFFKKRKISRKLKFLNENLKAKFLMVFYLNEDVQFEVYRQIMFSNIGVKVKDDAGFSILIRREHEYFKEEDFKKTNFYDSAIKIVFEDMKYFMVFCEGDIDVLNDYIKKIKVNYNYDENKSIKEELSIDFIPDDHWFVDEDLKEVIYPS